MPLLLCLHPPSILVIPLDGLPNRLAYLTSDILTAMVMTHYVAGTDTVWLQTFLILAFGNMFPQSFHPCTVWRDKALIVLMSAFGSVVK
jgi:hypothetical protein